MFTAFRRGEQADFERRAQGASLKAFRIARSALQRCLMKAIQGRHIGCEIGHSNAGERQPHSLDPYRTGHMKEILFSENLSRLSSAILSSPQGRAHVDELCSQRFRRIFMLRSLRLSVSFHRLDSSVARLTRLWEARHVGGNRQNRHLKWSLDALLASFPPEALAETPAASA